MKLVGFAPTGNRLHFVRDLNEDEIAQDQRYTPIFTEARGRFHLFKILHQNYEDWLSYINLLLRQVNLTSVLLTISCDAAKLAENSRDWKRSKLTGKEGEIEIAEIVQEFHQRMLQSYGAFVAELFFPDLLPIAQFYMGLTREVKKHGDEFIMCFANDPDVKTTSDKQTLNLKLHFAPNDLIAELGIIASVKK
ncbi:MAG TPA: hypothetical protein VK742_00135 [Candidatus Sulfotelmatobacter sp.]|jgi:hypothetical protein|nr:hypothetical protein [Candidatus Sulfotelmatobacter sp.]